MEMDMTGRALINKYILTVFTVILTAALLPVTVYAAEASVTFGSERYDKTNGEQFPVGIYINGDSIVADYYVEVRYDCLRLKYISGADEADEENGILIFENSASTEQVKLWLTFEAISGGEAQLAVDTAEASAPNGDSFSMTSLQAVSVYIAGEDIAVETETSREAVNAGADGSQESGTGDGTADSGASGGVVASRPETGEGMGAGIGGGNSDAGEVGSFAGGVGSGTAGLVSDTGMAAGYGESVPTVAGSIKVLTGQASAAEDSADADSSMSGIMAAGWIGIICVIGAFIAIIYMCKKRSIKGHGSFRDMIAAPAGKRQGREYDEGADHDENMEYEGDSEAGYSEGAEYDVSVEYEQNADCNVDSGYDQSMRYDSGVGYDRNVNYNAGIEYDQSIRDDAGTEYGENAEYDASAEYEQNADCNADYGYDQSAGYNADTEYDQDTKHGMSAEHDENVGCDAAAEYDWDTGYDEPAENGGGLEFNRDREPDTDPEPDGKSGINKKARSQKRKRARRQKRSDRIVEAADQEIYRDVNDEFSEEISSAGDAAFNEDAALNEETDSGEKTGAGEVPVIAQGEEGEIPIIKVENVTMKFKVATGSTSGLKDYVIQRIKKQITTRDLLALNDVSFDIFKGEVVGIIGTNGSGKSTLLKIISGALKPTSGRVTVDRSKIQILTLGTGFDVELTARENVYLNGAIIGYPREFIHEHYDEIVEFAELEGFMDTKVKNFSSGMVSRLGFAIATVGEAAEILILDEVLSVGDEFFRKKSLKRIREMIHSGSTVIMVSHGMGTILENCVKVVWIEKGVLQMVGDAETVCAAYRKLGMS